MGYSQKDAGFDQAKQAEVVLGQIQATAKLARNASTPQGYFLGSCFFQHTFVDASHFEAFVTTGTPASRSASQTAPCPACGKGWRVDKLTPLPVWNSVTKGYSPAGSALDLELPHDAREPEVIEPRP